MAKATCYDRTAALLRRRKRGVEVAIMARIWREITQPFTDDSWQMTPEQRSHPILINGGGMVGLTLALALAEAGFSVRLLDSEAAPRSPAQWQTQRSQAVFDQRVSALTLGSQQLLQRLGVWQALTELRLCPYHDMQVWDAEGTGAIHFAAEEVQRQELGHIVENPLLCSVLEAALQQHPAVQCSYGQRLQSYQREGSEWVSTCQDGTDYRCQLLIGADGSHSTVRTQAGFATRRWSYEQRALVCTLRSTQPHRHTAWQRFMQTGPVALLPLYLPGAEAQYYSSLVWSCDLPLADELLALSDGEFTRRLGTATEHVLGEIAEVTPRSAFALQQQHAVDYVQPGIALVGDAAHTIHPLAGQGVNLGLADVECLVQVLQAAQQRGEDIASLQTLSRYQRQRKGSNLGMMAMMEAFKWGFGSDALSLRWLRNAGLRITNESLFMKRALMKQAMGLP
jgi:2-polyprenylphenol 6-hydroxylase